MSNATDASNPTSPEPSMEDILSSIRRILSDSGEEAEAETEAPPARPVPAKPAKAKAGSASLAEVAAGKPETPAAREPEAPPRGQAQRFQEITFAEREEDDPPAERERPEDISPPRDNVFHLTADMRLPPERQVLSRSTSNATTDVLSQLAKAILDRRDIAVGGRDMTIEGLVREMLRPMLKEWLDRNLPYLIERLVKKEIDLMVNRAERL